MAVQTLGWREARALSSSPPGQGGIQILAAAMVAEACGRLCDHAAPFQQVFVEFVEVPQLQHTVEQIILAPMLDVPVPLMEEQLLVDAFAPHETHVPEQVIEVPKILIDDLSVRTLVREPQLAEQLVEVPPIISFSSLQRIVEQNVGIPVPYGGVRGLQGFHPGQDSTSSPLSLERLSERNVEQIVDSRGFGGGLQDFLPGQSSSSSVHTQSGGHSCCAAENRRDSTGAVLGCLGGC